MLIAWHVSYGNVDAIECMVSDGLIKPKFAQLNSSYAIYPVE